MKALLVLGLTLDFGLWTLDLHAGTGTTGGDSLNVGVGAKWAAMGETGISQMEDANSILLNPAGLEGLRQLQGSFHQTSLTDSLQLQTLVMGIPLGPVGSLGIGFSYFNAGSIDAYDASDARIGSVSVFSRSLILGGSYPIKNFFGHKETLYLGGAIVHYLEHLAGFEASNMLFTAGVQARLQDGRWKGGLVFSNLGGNLKFDQTTEQLPQTIGAGVGYTASFGKESLEMGLDVKIRQGSPLILAAGAEYKLQQRFFVRAGLQLAGEGQPLRPSFGFGLPTQWFDLDYAFIPMGEIGSSHRLSILIRWGRAQRDNPEIGGLIQEGLRLMELGDYAHAVLSFNRVLELDPNHERAKELLKEASQKMLGEQK